MKLTIAVWAFIIFCFFMSYKAPPHSVHAPLTHNQVIHSV